MTLSRCPLSCSDMTHSIQTQISHTLLNGHAVVDNSPSVGDTTITSPHPSSAPIPFLVSQLSQSQNQGVSKAVLLPLTADDESPASVPVLGPAPIPALDPLLQLLSSRIMIESHSCRIPLPWVTHSAKRLPIPQLNNSDGQEKVPTPVPWKSTPAFTLQYLRSTRHPMAAPKYPILFSSILPWIS